MGDTIDDSFLVEMKKESLADLVAKLPIEDGKIVDFVIGKNVYKFCYSPYNWVSEDGDNISIVAKTCDDKFVLIETVQHSDSQATVTVLSLK